VTRYLFDTTALAEVLKAAPSRRFIRRLTMIAPSDRWTTAMSVAELLYAARQDGSSTLMKDVLSLIAAVRVAPFDLAAARDYAKLRASTERAGADATDLVTAAIAKSGEFVLVTHHPDRFATVAGLHPSHRASGSQTPGRASRPPRR
jgi:tRNA(fMet)-specific endonuclease VapC